MCDACRTCRECGWTKPLDDMRLQMKNGTWVCDMCVRRTHGDRPHYPGKRMERDVEE
jgi:hypothetical protein